MSLDDLAPVITLGMSENKKIKKVGNNGSQRYHSFWKMFFISDEVLFSRKKPKRSSTRTLLLDHLSRKFLVRSRSHQRSPGRTMRVTLRVRSGLRQTGVG